jgi:hypothetical protein
MVDPIVGEIVTALEAGSVSAFIDDAEDAVKVAFSYDEDSVGALIASRGSRRQTGTWRNAVDPLLTILHLACTTLRSTLKLTRTALGCLPQ